VADSEGKACRDLPDEPMVAGPGRGPRCPGRGRHLPSADDRRGMERQGQESLGAWIVC